MASIDLAVTKEGMTEQALIRMDSTIADMMSKVITGVDMQEMASTEKAWTDWATAVTSTIGPV